MSQAMQLASEGGPCIRRLRKVGTTSAAGALEFAHVADQRFDGIVADSVIQRDAHAANRAVAGRAHQIRACGALGEFLFDGFVAAGQET